MAGGFLTRRAVVGAGAAATVAGATGTALAQGRKPNIVFIMADDLGYADVGCYGQRAFATPNIDRISAQGVRLTDGYSNSAVCSATRTGLITGRYQYRLRCGLDEPIGADRSVGLPPGLPTLPAQLKALGYRTALVGKWHLGASPTFGPLKSGYDVFFGIHEGGADYFSHKLGSVGGLREGDRIVDKPGYMTDLLGERAVAEIETASRMGQPLFLSLHFTAPHWPWESPQDEALARTLKDPMHWDGGNLATYAEMVKSMDANIGRVLQALDRAGMADNTIVVFTSDNGGERFSDTWPFTGVKTELLEGGIRVPLIVSWPGRIPAGSVSPQVMISMDFLPTFMAAAGGKPQAGFAPDGEDLLDVLTGKAPPRPRTLFWRYKANEQAAVRDGHWKYLLIGGREHLFNLAQDQRERADLKLKEPEVFQRLKAQFAAWNADMLPYPAGMLDHSLKQNLPDRY